MAHKELMALVRGFERGDVGSEHIGDGVSVIRLRDEDRETIYEQNSKSLDRWDLFHGGQTHVFINRYDSDQLTDHEAEQEIIRAFMAVRILQPASLATHIVIEVTQDDEGKTIFKSSNRIGFYSMTYVSQSDETGYVNREDIRRARIMWPQIQHAFKNWRQHGRIIRAAQFFEIAFGNHSAEARHILFHTSLECLLCTESGYLGQQVRQRVKALCPEMEDKDIKEIWEVRGGLVHSGSIIEPARGRAEKVIQRLERVLRACLYHVFSEPKSVEIFSDKEKIKKHFPVEVEEAKWVTTGHRIFV